MIIIRMMGGLGNQMFQYALGRRLALKHNVPLKLDLSWFTTQNKRTFKLDNFQTVYQIAEEEDISRLRNDSNLFLLSWLHNIYQRHLPYWKRRFIWEIDSGKADNYILRAPANCYISGYWQSEIYFSHISENLKNEFELKAELPVALKNLEKEIISHQDSVSVHIRRGDYVEEETSHYICPKEYYFNAIDYIASEISFPHFYFFSDDITWVENNIRINRPATYITPTSNEVFDLILLSKCKHHINANSSFSWWGAWLGETNESLVIVPNKWFIDRPFPQDRVPKRWIIL